jgi:hypothetical protein
VGQRCNCKQQEGQQPHLFVCLFVCLFIDLSWRIGERGTAEEHYCGGAATISTNFSEPALLNLHLHGSFWPASSSGAEVCTHVATRHHSLSTTKETPCWLLVSMHRESTTLREKSRGWKLGNTEGTEERQTLTRESSQPLQHSVCQFCSGKSDTTCTCLTLIDTLGPPWFVRTL